MAALFAASSSGGVNLTSWSDLGEKALLMFLPEYNSKTLSSTTVPQDGTLLLVAVLVMVLITIVMVQTAATGKKGSKITYPKAVGEPAWLPAAIHYGKNPVAFLRKCAKMFNHSPFEVNLGLVKLIFVNHEVGKELLALPDSVANPEAFITKILGDAFFPPNEDSKAISQQLHHDNDETPWHQIRFRLLSFGINRPRQLEHSAHLVKEQIQLFAEKVKSLPSFDPFHHFSAVTLRFLLIFLFGRDLFASEEEIDHLAELSRNFEIAVSSPIRNFVPWLPFGPPKRCNDAKKALFTAIRAKIELIRERVEKTVDFEAIKHLTNPISDNDLPLCHAEIAVRWWMHANLKARREGKPEAPISVISRQMLAVLFAGHINTAMTTAWSFCHLGFDQKLQQEIREKDAALTRSFRPNGASERTVAFTSLSSSCSDEAGDKCETSSQASSSSSSSNISLTKTPQMEFLHHFKHYEAVVNETMFHHAPAFLHMPREVQSESVTLAGMTFQKGKFLAVNINSTIPKLLEDAGQTDLDVYRPSRWESEEGQKLIRNRDILYFGVGKHICTGRILAQILIKTTFLELLREYRIDLLNETFPPPDYTKSMGLAPPNNAKCRIVKV